MIHSKSKINYSLLAIIFCSFVVTLLYQNCAKLNIKDLEAASKAQEAERLAIGKDDETVVVGVNQVPDLKMFFVVDNSGTMKENQFNLSESFGSMFDANSTDSLSKFDTTAVLISTAQKSPSFLSEKSTLDKIADQQKFYNLGLISPQVFFVASIRSALQNFGYLPGDNIGYQISLSSNPLKYSFMPAAVLGTTTKSGQISYSSSIRKLASENSSVLESEFKNRLAILNSDRIPLVLTGNQYKPEHANVVDSESGLCAIARILRNPDQNIKSGDLLSFTVVSDENDNDPKGLNCIQSITEFTGNEDLVDGECKQRETSVSYKVSSSTKSADSCKINGSNGYNYKISYPNTRISTQISFKNISKAAVYKAAYSSLTYKAQTKTYQYLNTDISYYYETCIDIISDGLVTGKKCSINATPIKDSKAGDFTADCYALAKSLKSTAVNSMGNTPVCTAVYKSSGSCIESDPNCKINFNVANKTVSGILGSFDTNACLAKAQGYADYATGYTPVCVDASKMVSSCSVAEQSAGCGLVSAVEYGSKTVSVSGDYTKNTLDCFNYAKVQAGNAVSLATDVTQCLKIETPEVLVYNSTLAFSETASLDGNISLALNTDCGVLLSLATAKAKAANSGIQTVNSCIITGYTKATETNEAIVSNCNTQADNRCAAQALRNCSGIFVAGNTSTSTGSLVLFNKVSEDIKCANLCSESKLGVCDGDKSSNVTIEQFLKNKYGDTAVCAAVTTEIAASKEIKLAVLTANQGTVCKDSMVGVPSYFTVTKPLYHTKSLELDYVAGTKKNALGESVPALELTDYIQARSQAISNSNAIFSALVRKGTDTLGLGGSYGVDYENLIKRTNGQIGSVLSNDYSIVLKDLGHVIKSNLERTFVLKKMKSIQVIKKVYRLVKATNQQEVVDQTLWKQNGATIVFQNGLDLNDGDQFKVEFQNY
ncbi:MAG: hypothetical protein WA160_16460 [Pseudobdellovibrio sp.]